MTSHSAPSTVSVDLRPVRRALLSVTDKTGLVDFARSLAGHGVELVSTGGTAKALRDAGLTVKDISDLTGFPEMLDGRVKTLHPKVHGGILHMRGNPEHVAAVESHGIEPIDMVVVNLYAFEKTAQKPGVAFADVIENIDIGGPSMVRSAAKNFEDVAIVTSVSDYGLLTEELKANKGALSRATRWRLAKRAFSVTAAYDAGIASALEKIEEPSGPVAFADGLPQTLRIIDPLAQTLRYGENPHQRAALYVDGTGTGVAAAQQLQGKELSYNNLVDLDACWELVSEFDASAEAAVAIIKHTNPCGASTGTTVLEAYRRALEADPVSAFGGVIGINREVDGAAAEEIAKLFVEAIVAPGFTKEALERFALKKNLRLVKIASADTRRVVKQVSGGFLVQDADRLRVTEDELKVVTDRKPTQEEMRALLFAWRVCKHVKSNAIVYARYSDGHGQTVGIGAGQMSRVDAAKFGAMKAVLPLKGTVAASDAFFPFPDGLETIAEAGATAVIQPGGSVKDEDVIAAANRLGVAMVFTGFRHFRHG
ncbi:bifunctional phosphoribosylaminoimidazolecarboxamide formyltransferase/IMP cyclohydrolase [Edaphobacter sp. 12200R-103]|uniref:bifunctional phosphoribosylaminoimidazolecarboxamide formyltransferase/IMP cyclohydrolase n=1 Tax=Edaphobacter sp. 12200R-103 TaxID=2703788 RepID=UPI00138B5FFB|nr:bifunctional phosphoribosylaminoimidazolecarboxamide formyltransferase/IMP cyclohydrolase [Edaphobacter sp. 12200R-103]QHS51087.1 bifunctional phosphoribosylaminoimidazolecarboxamide formyltransferase/IMP cyclohydrolase [Edaphobacter sp. 12200R-103]